MPGDAEQESCSTITLGAGGVGGWRCCSCSFLPQRGWRVGEASDSRACKGSSMAAGRLFDAAGWLMRFGYLRVRVLHSPLLPDHQ